MSHPDTDNHILYMTSKLLPLEMILSTYSELPLLLLWSLRRLWLLRQLQNTCTLSDCCHLLRRAQPLLQQQ